MNMDKIKKGFTIVEVTLVLALAGIIMMMVFIAVPSVQRAQRDAQRREDVAFVLSQIKTYQANNRGALPYINTAGMSTTDYYIGYVYYNGATVVSSARSSGWRTFYRQYLLGEDDGFVSPEGNYYYLYIYKISRRLSEVNRQISLTNHAWGNDIFIFEQAYCDGEYIKYSPDENKVTILTRLEGGGVLCENN